MGGTESARAMRWLLSIPFSLMFVALTTPTHGRKSAHHPYPTAPIGAAAHGEPELRAAFSRAARRHLAVLLTSSIVRRARKCNSALQYATPRAGAAWLANWDSNTVLKHGRLQIFPLRLGGLPFVASPACQHRYSTKTGLRVAPPVKAGARPEAGRSPLQAPQCVRAVPSPLSQLRPA